ncbi:DUF349 domain-containing protein [Prevotella copri]|uniref:DUF349 domain-containing protein n=1 Tax=Segatella copri TaxID=165179 RepID=UPI001290B02B|nr:DUF349 domain-containing protein [Segatella copri]MQN43019.1 DUF349 domain-containing protein [Segatella copri]MQN48702.1 DUF349 domain-containing protein [Segatella copri]MQN53226.1 DUF349 domain-containing protein [Segatella copri]MQN54541.1 DUF349 domain-containing protein [Segatella copri]MQN57878.1 DUF349 domain-containing protein [Segatella copri]
MMDSQEKALLQQSTLEDPAKKAYATKQEVLERVKEIAHSSENPNKEELDLLKTTFYKIHLAERDAQMKEYLAKGGDPEKYILLPDDTEEAFKAEMQLIKEKRAKIFLAQEEEKQDNLRKKEEIIEKIKAMTTSPEEANKSYQDFKALQQEWKEIKNIPADKANEVWKNYQLYVEQFYDMLKLNSEAREYDFKKNLEAKTQLCEAAEKLNEEEDVISAFHQLQDLHQQYREIGPVAKELREQIWERFKAASTVINKKHQQHFEDLRAKEEENLAKKTSLCEKVEAANQGEYKTAKDWEKVTQEIIEIQKEWRTIGFAPQKMNVKIFERFRIANDKFFNKKAEFFKGLKDTYSANLEKKQQLVNKAKELADNTDWKKTGDKFIALQKEWKKVGTVPHKQGELLWKEFLDTCNKFFEARNKQNAGSRSEEHANLDKKRNIIAQLKELVIAEISDNDFQKKLKNLAKQYSAIGHVPFKEKDKVYKEYHEAIDAAYKKLHATNAKRHFDNFKNNLKNVAKEGGNALGNERGKLLRRYDQLRIEITTYENNLGFFNTASKKGNSLVEEMNRKIEKLKADLEMVKQKIKAIDAEKK